MSKTLKRYGQMEKTSTETVDLKLFDKELNIYEAISVMGKRAKQVNNELKQEFEDRVVEVQTRVDNLEEVEENEDQILLSKKFESLPKPATIAMNEFLDERIYHRLPSADDSESKE